MCFVYVGVPCDIVGVGEGEGEGEGEEGGGGGGGGGGENGKGNMRVANWSAVYAVEDWGHCTLHSHASYESHSLEPRPGEGGKERLVSTVCACA